MDPVSITGNAIAILQLTRCIIIGTKKSYKNARDYPAEISGLLNELISLETILENLQLMVEKANGIHASKLFFGVKKGDGGQIWNCLDSMWVFKR